MKVGNYEQMMAHLKDPFNPSELRARVKELEQRESFAIGGGIIQGENLGTREGFADPITNEQFKKLYTKFQKDKKNIGTDGEFAEILNKKYVNNKGNKFSASTIYKKRKDLGIKTAVKGGTAPPSVLKQVNEVNKYLGELIPELNAQEKYYTKEEVSSMVEKKLKLKPKYKTIGDTTFKVNKFESYSTSSPNVKILLNALSIPLIKLFI